MRTHLGGNHAPDVTTEDGHTIIPEICMPDLFVFTIITILGYQPCAYFGHMLTVAQTQPKMTSILTTIFHWHFMDSTVLVLLYHPQGPFASCVLLDGTVYGAVSTTLDAEWGIKQCE